MRRLATHRQMLAVAALFLPQAAMASPTNSATLGGTVTAAVIQPSAIARIDDLRFGQFFQPTGNGNLTIDPDGTITTSGGMTGLTGVTQIGTGRGPGRFLISGDPNRNFTVSLPNFINIAKGADTMRVQNFRTNVPNPRGTLSAAGQFLLVVGARLQVRANQAIGTYSGTYAVTVTYQ